MGERDFEPATAQPEPATKNAKTRIRSGRFAKSMRAGLVAIVAGFSALPVVAQELELIGSYDWNTEAVVGVSAIEMKSDGMGFFAISDRGWWVEGRLLREHDKVSGVVLERLKGLTGTDGFPVSARRVGDLSDAEGLAIAEDGTTWVSFERWAHVWKYDRPFGKASWTKDHPTFYDHSDNWQLEAIAVSPDNVVYAFSEKPLLQGFPIYRLQSDNTWTIDGYLPEQEVFAIVGADFAADGSLYLLERKLVVGLWWQNRLRRVRLDGSEDRVLWTSERGAFGNLEGISVWEDDRGTRFTMVSDNNGRQDKPTEFVEFRLTE